MVSGAYNLKTRAHKAVPQWAVRVWCRWTRHRQTTYSAQMSGIVVKVSTCRCGDVQSAEKYGGQFPRKRA